MKHEDCKVNIKYGQELFLFTETYRNQDGTISHYIGTVNQIDKARSEEVERMTETWIANRDDDVSVVVGYEIEWARIKAKSKPISVWAAMTISGLIIMSLILILGL